MAKKKESLSTLRKEIDSIDKKLVELLDRRADLAIRTARHKKDNEQGVHHPAREAQVVEKALSRAEIFPRSSLVAIYREIIGASLSLERAFEVAILGPQATYTHVAAIKHFGHSAKIRFEASIPDVFLRVEKADVDVGIVPVENSTEGVVVHTLDALVDSSLIIAGEILLPVRHSLLVHPSWDIRDTSGHHFKKIVSHPQALAQCRAFLEATFPGVPLEEAPSTAAAAQAAAKKPGTGAIASALAAETYGLVVVHDGIEDKAGNTTRFLLLKRDTGPTAIPTPTGRDKTSIAFAMKDRPGALAHLLEPFKKRKINLTKIESRPSRLHNWRYVFFLDMEGHSADITLQRAFHELEKECYFFRILGSYPRSPDLQP